MGVKKQTGSGSQRLHAPQSSAPEPSDHMPPAFSFAELRKGYSIPDCQHAGKSKELLDAIWMRSQMTWRDIMIASHWKLGFEKLDQDLFAGPIAGMTPDQKILGLRFASATARIYGYRDPDYPRIFRVLWIDPKLELIKH